MQYIVSIKLSKKFGFIELLLPYVTGVLKLRGLSNGIETFGNYADTKSEIQKIIAQISSRKIGDVIAWSIYSHPNFLNSVYRADSIVSVDFIDRVFIINTFTEEFLTNNGKDYNLIRNYFDRIIYDLKYLKSILESYTYIWILPPKDGLPYFEPLNFEDYYMGMSVIHCKAEDMLLDRSKIMISTRGFGLYVNPVNCIFISLIDEGNSITYNSEVGISEMDLGWDTMYLLGIKKSDGNIIGNFFKPNSVYAYSDFSLFLSPNPVTEKLSLINIPDNATEFEIYDQFGNRQISGLISGQIDVSLLPAGVYFLKLNNSLRPFKFLKI